MLRQTLLRLSRDDRVRRHVMTAPGAPDLVARFVAGSTVDEVVAVGSDLVAKGLLVTIDKLGEDATSASQADEAAEEYRVLLTAMHASGLAERGDVSVKLSALGLGVGGDGAGLAAGHVRSICEAADAVGATVTVDMEDHTRTDVTLDIVRDLRQSFPRTAVVLQAYLRRTEQDCHEFASEGSRVRLCKGAYAKVPSISFATRHEVDLSYVRCLRVLMEGQGYPMVATHDPRLVGIAEELAGRTGRDRDSFEFQMLHGIRPLEQRRLCDVGYRSRVYLPYGPDWYEYFVRRVAEKPGTIGLFGRTLLSRR